MDIDQFWQLIEESRKAIDPTRKDGNLERQCREIAALLSSLPLHEIVSFRDHFQDRMIAAYDYSLWAAAYLIGQGCSDDGFMDFRSWLISMGRDAYEQALEDPDSLADVVRRPGIESIFFEEFPSVPDQVYEQRAGQEMPDYPGEYPDSPTGQRRGESDTELRQRFPRLWAQYGSQLRPS